MRCYIAVDIGGTQIRAALYPEEGFTPLQQMRIPTVDNNQAPLERMIQLIQQIWPEDGEVKSIAIASPGFINSAEGLVLSAPNIAGFTNLPVARIVAKRFSVPVFLGNDANLAVMGESLFGSGRGHQDILYLTISTGIGGGIISHGRLVEGTHGIAGELGHVTVEPDGPLCACGKRGHLEALASGTAIAKYVMDKRSEGRTSLFPQGSLPDGKEIAEAARKGDALSIEAFERAGFYLGRALADFLAIFNPSLLILGGGVSFSGDLLRIPLKRSLDQHVVSREYLQGLSITTASLGDDTGLLGALALQHQKDQQT